MGPYAHKMGFVDSLHSVMENLFPLLFVPRYLLGLTVNGREICRAQDEFTVSKKY